MTPRASPTSAQRSVVAPTATSHLPQSKRPGKSAQPGHCDMFVALNLNFLSLSDKGNGQGLNAIFFNPVWWGKRSEAPAAAIRRIDQGVGRVNW